MGANASQLADSKPSRKNRRRRQRGKKNPLNDLIEEGASFADVSSCFSPPSKEFRLPVPLALPIAEKKNLAQKRDPETGKLPLHIAAEAVATAEETTLQVFSFLIEQHPASVTCTDAQGRIPLHYACQKSRFEATKLLLEADPETCRTVTVGEEWTPLHLACQKITKSDFCSKEFDEETLQIATLLLQYDATLAASVSSERGGSVTPLTTACHCRPSLRLVELLVQHHPAACWKADALGRLPIHHAALKNASTAVIHYLCQQSKPDESPPEESPASPEDTNSYDCESGDDDDLVAAAGAAAMTDHAGYLPLHFACARHNVNAVKVLLEAFPESLDRPTTTNEQGWTPLHEACDLSEAVIAIGTGVQEKHQQAQLLGAVHSRALAVVEYLLQQDSKRRRNIALQENQRPKIQEQPRTEQPLGRTNTLHHPSSLTKIQAINSGWTPLIMACHHHAPLSIVKALVEHDDDRSTPKMADDTGGLPLHHAVSERADAAVVEYLLRQWPAAAQVPASEGWLPLHFASQACHVAAVKTLLDMYPEANQTKTKRGFTPLHLTCECDNLSSDDNDSIGDGVGNKHGFETSTVSECLRTCQLLLDRNPNLTKAQTKMGATPLAVACSNRAPLPVIQFLVGADPEALYMQDSAGWLPLDLTMQRQAAVVDLKRMDHHVIAFLKSQQKEHRSRAAAPNANHNCNHKDSDSSEQQGEAGCLQKENL